MTMGQFSLSWNAYKQNICSGLSALQQNGEFVDMTLAADGHHVKVHQMVLSLVSPYIKELIASANCPHPVIFLNKISHPTLRAILEYIYTGEVMVGREHLPALIEAGKELHIKGLEDMKLDSITSDIYKAELSTTKSDDGQDFKAEPTDVRNRNEDSQFERTKVKRKKVRPIQEVFLTDDDQNMNQDQANSVEHSFIDDDMDSSNDGDTNSAGNQSKDYQNSATQIQYTISNRGAIQMILNRFMYNLVYTGRKPDSHRQWRCVDAWDDKKCQAKVVTRADTVLKRMGAHTHSYHDKRILKKVRDNVVYTALKDAQFVSTSQNK